MNDKILQFKQLINESNNIVFFGGGQDYEQSIVSADLMKNKKEDFLWVKK